MLFVGFNVWPVAITVVLGLKVKRGGEREEGFDHNNKAKKVSDGQVERDRSFVRALISARAKQCLIKVRTWVRHLLSFGEFIRPRYMNLVSA